MRRTVKLIKLMVVSTTIMYAVFGCFIMALLLLSGCNNTQAEIERRNRDREATAKRHQIRDELIQTLKVLGGTQINRVDVVDRDVTDLFPSRRSNSDYVYDTVKSADVLIYFKDGRILVAEDCRIYPTGYYNRTPKLKILDSSDSLASIIGGELKKIKGELDDFK